MSTRNAAKRRVLIVEDNLDVGDTLHMLLDAIGFEAHLVRDGESAVRKAQDLTPDVVVLDIGLPGISGYEAARMIRALRLRDLMIIALTGWGQPADLERSAAVGIDHHLHKPVQFSALMDILDA